MEVNCRLNHVILTSYSLGNNKNDFRNNEKHASDSKFIKRV